jgi:hypothetical protein
MKRILIILACSMACFFWGLHVGGRDARIARELIDYAASVPTDETGGKAIRQHPHIGPITNILIKPDCVEVYGKPGHSRIWYP